MNSTSLKTTASKNQPDGLMQVRRRFADRTIKRGMDVTMRFRGISAELGCVVLEGTPSEDHCNPNGTVHQGYATMILDSAIGLAIQTRICDDLSFGKTDLKVTFLRPLMAKSGLLRAEGTVIHMSTTMAVCEAELTDNEGTLCAIATGTCLLFPHQSTKCPSAPLGNAARRT